MNPSAIYCSACGAGNNPQAIFCFNCGQKIQKGTLPPQAPQPQQTLVSTLASSTPTPQQVSHLNATGSLPQQYMLKQRYLIVKRVGQGGMGAVYQATDTQFGSRTVAIKEMSQNNLGPQDAAVAVELFKQEAHLLANLKHPNLPSIYEHFTENGRWYLVMDFIEGETLAAYIDKQPGRVIPILEVLVIGIQLSKVLGYLHTRPNPIVFRDLKPANIMRTPDGHIYLIDFGIARLFKPDQAKDTLVSGSFGYAAPEQFGHAQTTPQSDIYSLGATLHEMLSGNHPRDNKPMFVFQPLRSYNPALPVVLDSLVAQMVSMDEKQRPASMQVVRQELEHIQKQLQQESELTTLSMLHQSRVAPTIRAGQSEVAPTVLANSHSSSVGAHDQGVPNIEIQTNVARSSLPKYLLAVLLIGGILGVIEGYVVWAMGGSYASYIASSSIGETTLSIYTSIIAASIVYLLSNILIGFLLGKIAVVRISGFLIGCINGTSLTLTLMTVSGSFSNITFSLALLHILLLIMPIAIISGCASMLGLWLVKHKNPHYVSEAQIRQRTRNPLQKNIWIIVIIIGSIIGIIVYYLQTYLYSISTDQAYYITPLIILFLYFFIGLVTGKMLVVRWNSLILGGSAGLVAGLLASLSYSVFSDQGSSYYYAYSYRSLLLVANALYEPITQKFLYYRLYFDRLPFLNSVEMIISSICVGAFLSFAGAYVATRMHPYYARRGEDKSEL